MTTDLPAGTYFRFRHMGTWDYGCVSKNRVTYTLLSEDQVPVKAIVHDCVWTGARRSVLESRGVRRG